MGEAKGKRLEIQPSTLGPIQSSNCGHQQCVGQFNAFMHIGAHSVMTTFYVVDQQLVPILLGSQFFRANRALWDFETDTLVLRPESGGDDEVSSFPRSYSTDIRIPASSSVLYVARHLRKSMRPSCIHDEPLLCWHVVCYRALLSSTGMPTGTCEPGQSQFSRDRRPG